MAECLSPNTAVGKHDVGDLTNCPICFETYTTPKSLPCLHTFCEHCLQSYINSLLKKDKAPTGFKCPLCRKLVPSPGSLEKVTEWASLMQVNHFMNTLIDRSNMKSGEKLCNACQRENESTTATTWCKECMEAMCEMCSKWHRKLIATKSHETVPIGSICLDDIPIHGDSVNCANHSGKRLEFFCSDHNLSCCITCVTLDHRKCESVDTLENVSIVFRKSHKVQELMKELDNRRDEINKRILQKNENIESIEKDAVKIEDDIMNFVKELENQIAKIKNDCFAELTKTKKSKVEEITKTREEFETLSTLLQNYRGILDMANRHGTDVHLFLEYQRIRNLAEECKTKDLEIRAYNQSVSLSFTMNDDVMRLKSATLTQLGNLNVTVKADLGNVPRIDMMSAVPVLIREFDSPLGAEVSGAVFLGQNQLLLADRKNLRIIVCDDTGELVQEIMLDSKPFGVDYLNDRDVVISFEDNAVVQMFDTCSMSLGRQVTLQFPCRAMSSYGDGMMVASSRYRIHRFNVRGKGDKIVDCSSSYCVHTGRDSTVWYAHYSEHVLLCVSGSGKVLFRYCHDNLRHPFGLGVDCQGNAYIAGLTSNNLHQVSVDGQQNRILLSSDVGGTRTCCVKFKPNSNIFLVTSNNGRKIKLYEMK